MKTDETMKYPSYSDYIADKAKSNILSGIAVSPNELPEALFDFQIHCVTKALANGRFCLFEDCGLGKTLQQLTWAQVVYRHTNLSVLILAPFAVSDQTIGEGHKFGIEVRDYDDYEKYSYPGIYITNYEQLHNIDTSVFAGIVLDESSILKNFEGATKNLIINKFRYTPYKLACSATPSPNDPMELGNHAEFLGIMTRNEMLSMYFVHDGGNTSAWRLKGHAISTFWSWVSSWAIMISSPSDIGFTDEGYELPPLNIIERQISTEKRNNGMLFNDIAVNATNFNAELRNTKLQRMELAAQIVNGSNENFIMWIKQDEEADILRSLIRDAVEVRGSEPAKVKKAKLLGFGRGEFRVLITKQKIAQYGMNYQNCHNQVFASLDFSFEALYQSIRRSYRFGQQNAVNIYMITTDTMQNVQASIKSKQDQDIQMRCSMIQAMGLEYQKQTKSDSRIKFQLPNFLSHDKKSVYIR